MIGLLEHEARRGKALPAAVAGSVQVGYREDREGFDYFGGPFSGETDLTQLAHGSHPCNTLHVKLESLSIYVHRFPQAVRLRAARDLRRAAICYIVSPSLRTTEHGQEWRKSDVVIAGSDLVDIVTRGPSTFVWIEFPRSDADAPDASPVFQGQGVRMPHGIRAVARIGPQTHRLDAPERARHDLPDVRRTLFSVDSNRLDRLREYIAEKLPLVVGGREATGMATFSSDDEWGLRRMLESLVATATARDPDARRVSDYEFTRRVEAFMLERIDEPLTLGQIASSVDCSAGTLINIFKRTVGLSPMAYSRIARLNEARRRIERTALPQPRIIDIAVDCGFWHLGHFGTAYKTMFGKTPSQSRSNRVHSPASQA